MVNRKRFKFTELHTFYQETRKEEKQNIQYV